MNDRRTDGDGIDHDRCSDDQTPRFEFGDNWRSFLKHIDPPRIATAIDSLQTLLGIDRLDGQTFLDIGSGSGLSSLAAHRLGAEVTSIDFDESSVWCTEQIRHRWASSPDRWRVTRGDVLDPDQMRFLGLFDVVYSWGVLHHTGRLDDAIDAAAAAVGPGGRLCIAIYNDQGAASRRWSRIKRIYQSLPTVLRPAWVAAVASVYEFKFALARLARGRNPWPGPDWRSKRRDRGMSVWHDWVDWVGGWPFEVATPAQIITKLIAMEFDLRYITTVGNGWGCNQYTFVRRTDSASTANDIPSLDKRDATDGDGRNATDGDGRGPQ